MTFMPVMSPAPRLIATSSLLALPVRSIYQEVLRLPQTTPASSCCVTDPVIGSSVMHVTFGSSEKHLNRLLMLCNCFTVMFCLKNALWLPDRMLSFSADDLTDAICSESMWSG